MTSVIITYNSVNGFFPGWHNGSRLFIYSIDYESLNALDNFLAELNMAVEDVSELYLYNGARFFNEQKRFLIELLEAGLTGRVVFIACPCSFDEKLETMNYFSTFFADKAQFELVPAECGGEEMLRKIALHVAG